MDTSRPKKRNSTRTRRAVLDATRVALTQHGAQVSMDLVARTAGVSKGGLLHHFRTRDELLLALVQDMYSAFASEVEFHFERESEGAGRLARAYVKATFRGLRESDNLIEHNAVLNLLHTVQPAVEFASEELKKWKSALRNDEVSPDVIAIVTLATDGLAAGSQYVTPPRPEVLDTLETQLLGLIDQQEDFARLLGASAPARA